MTEEFLLKSLKISKDLLVYFNVFNRHLYRYNGFEILKKLFLESFLDHDMQHIFRWCCTNNYYKLCKILLEDKRVTPTIYDLQEPVYHGHIETILCLLRDSRIDISGKQQIAMLAVIGGHVEVIKLLLNNSNIDKKSILELARSRGDSEILNLFKET